MSHFSVGDKVKFKTFVGTIKQFLPKHNTCIIILGAPMSDGARTMRVPVPALELLGATRSVGVKTEPKPKPESAAPASSPTTSSLQPETKLTPQAGAVDKKDKYEETTAETLENKKNSVENAESADPDV